MQGQAQEVVNQPNATLYVSNIDWKIKKSLLKRALYSLFSRYGKVLEIIVLRREGLRGQAWVIYDDLPIATMALQELQSFPFFNKPLKLQYARATSDRIAKRNGTFVPRNEMQTKKAKQRRQTKEEDDDEEQTKQEGGIKQEVPAKITTTLPSLEVETMKQEEKTDTKQETNDKANTEVSVPPSKILFAQNLPEECNEMVLGMLFRPYKGYKEVRIPRQGLAFIEFEKDSQATLALEGLQGFKLTAKDTLTLTYSSSS